MAALDSLEIYKNLFEKLPVAIFVIDVQTGNIVDANKQACKLVQRTYDELISLHQSKLHPPMQSSEIEDKFRRQIESLQNSQEVTDFEYLICDSKSNLIPVEISPTLITLNNKSLVVGLVKDLSVRKQRDNILSYYDKALDKSSSFLAFVDSNYVYQFVNTYYSKVFNKTKEEIIGSNLSDILGDEYFFNVVKEKFDFALKGNSVQYDTSFKIEGKERFLQANYEPYYSIDKKIIGVVISVFDLTKYKLYEQEKIKQEKLLIQQSKMAAMGEMLENIAHQWRQPLSVISTCTSGIMLQRDFDSLTDEILDESLKNIMNTTSYLSNTIDDFKNFFERDKQKIDFNVNDLINKTLSLVEMSFSSNDIALVKDFKEEIVIHNYKNELMQVVLNIINNAKDAILLAINDCEKIKLIKVSIFKEREYLKIQIHDNAGGIPKDIKDKIFEPYFTTKHQSQGTGIGLFMTQEIITKHMQGDIKVENKNFTHGNTSYHGALFTISIKIQ